MNQTTYTTPKSSRAVSVSVAGVLQIMGGMALTGLFGLVGVMQILRIAFRRNPFALGENLLLLACFAGCVLLVVRGISNLVLTSRYRRADRLMSGGRQKLEVLAKALGCSQEKAANQLRVMLARGFWQDGYFDLQEREFILGKPEAAASPEETVLREVKVRSIAPWILFGSVWVLYGVVPGVGMSLAMAVVLSVAVLVISRIAIPARRKVIEDRIPAARPVKMDTGDSSLNSVLQAANININKMAEYNKAIPNHRINTQVKRLVEVANELVRHLSDNPGKVRSARQFLNYYLPTTVKLLESYRELSRQTVQGENIGDTLRKIEEMLATLVKAYEKELDDLFRDRAMDISADIAVMQNMIRQGGLADDFFGKDGDS